MSRTNPPRKSPDIHAAKRLLIRARTVGSHEGHCQKRTALRYKLSAPVRMRAAGERSAVEATAETLNVSSGGLALWSEQEYPSGDAVQIREDRNDGCGGWFDAAVVHCAPDGDGFLIGLRLAQNLDSIDGSDPAAMQTTRAAGKPNVLVACVCLLVAASGGVWWLVT